MNIPSTVKRGVQFCDRVYGEDWPCQINLDELDLSMGGKCILGQLEGDFWQALGKHNIPNDGKGYGFWPLERSNGRTKQWREVILDLRTVRGCTPTE